LTTHDPYQDALDQAAPVGHSEPKPATEKAKPTERRGIDRRLIYLRVMVAIGKTVVHGRTEDISIAGGCIRLGEMLPSGLRIQIRILSPSNKRFDHLDVGAVVRYSSMTSGEPPCRVGVQFVDVDPEFKQKLLNIIQS